MATTELNISLTGPLKAYVEAKVESGAYGDPLAYVSDLILTDQNRELNLLEDRLLIAMESDPVVFTDEEWESADLIALGKDRLAQRK